MIRKTTSRLYPTIFVLDEFFPTKWHLCFPGPSLLLECFNSSGATGLTTTQILPNRKVSVVAKAAAKEMARFWKSTEGMAVKNYLEMKVPWKHVIQVCFWERKFIVDLNGMKWDFLIVESAHVDQYLTNSLDGIWNVWFSDFWLQLLGRSILKRETLTTCLLFRRPGRVFHRMARFFQFFFKPVEETIF